MSFILCPVSCSCFSRLLLVCQSAGSVLGCAWRCLEIKLLALLPSRLCLQKLPPDHLFGLHFLHSTNDLKLLSLLFIFCCVSLYVFVPPQSPDWVYLLGCLPDLVILCWKANLKSSNVLPFFYCWFCKESSNKQIHPTSPQHLVPFRSLKLMAWMSMWKERQDGNPANLQKLGMDPKEQILIWSIQEQSLYFYAYPSSPLAMIKNPFLWFPPYLLVSLCTRPSLCKHLLKKGKNAGSCLKQDIWTKGLEPLLCNFKPSVASIRSKVNFPFFCLIF